MGVSFFWRTPKNDGLPFGLPSKPTKRVLPKNRETRIRSGQEQHVDLSPDALRNRGLVEVQKTFADEAGPAPGGSAGVCQTQSSQVPPCLPPKRTNNKGFVCLFWFLFARSPPLAPRLVYRPPWGREGSICPPVPNKTLVCLLTSLRNA